MSTHSRRRIRKVRLRDSGGHADVADLSMSERLEMMWQLALDAWAFKGETEHAESRLQRHVVRVFRRERGPQGLADVAALEAEMRRRSNQQ